MIALVGAMFVAMGSVSADDHKVTISFNDSDGVVPDGKDVIVTVSVTAIESSDSAPTPTPTISWIRVSGELSGHELLTGNPPAPTNMDYDAGEAAGDSFKFVASLSRTVINPKGTAPGEYTVSAHVDPDGDDGSLKARTVTKILTVGGAGTGLDSATLTVTDMDGKPNANLNSAPADDDGTVYLTVQAKNSLGKNSNDGDVSQIIIYARGGDITIPAGINGNAAAGDTDFDDTADGTDRAENTSNPNALTASPANAKERFQVTAGGNVAASVDVYVTLIGGSGVVTSDTVNISFTGPADSISVGDPSGPLGQSNSEITIAVTATDSAGNGVALGPDDVSAVVKDRSGNDPNIGVEHQKGDNDRDGCRDGTLNEVGDALSTDAPCASGNGDDKRTTGTNEATGFTATPKTHYTEKPFDGKTVVVPVSTGAEKADPGEYTVVVTFGEEESEVTIHVAGPSASIEASTDAEGAVAIGQVIEVTAMVTDADGISVQNAVVDSDPNTDGNQTIGEPVTFTAVGALQLRTIGNDISTTVGTKDGVATARFVVTQGSGTATIIVSAGNASTFVSLNDAVEEEAMPEEEASVSCLSNLAGFATWACGVESSASEIFGLVSGRGATALHLWNGSAWVRYSVVDGTMVPGSSDFMVAENDILYISN